MKFSVSRILKNLSRLSKIWTSSFGCTNFEYYKKHCSGYKIIPFGNYCFPRVITTINRFKPTKKYGEESFPFDLCFSDFSLNTKLLATNFRDFYNNLQYDKNKKYYINNEFKICFGHDHIPMHKFRERYNKRIDNLYNQLQNQQLHIYFIVATFSVIPDSSIKLFINEINRYRKNNTYDLIIINQSKEKFTFEEANVHIIDLTEDKLFQSINQKGDWVGELKKMRSRNAIIFNHKIKKELSKLIIHNKIHDN